MYNQSVYNIVYLRKLLFIMKHFEALQQFILLSRQFLVYVSQVKKENAKKNDNLISFNSKSMSFFLPMSIVYPLDVPNGLGLHILPF